jgi:hypothetical protein
MPKTDYAARYTMPAEVPPPPVLTMASSHEDIRNEGANKQAYENFKRLRRKHLIAVALDNLPPFEQASPAEQIAIVTGEAFLES